jgi:membrane-associated phospholipid phosphatase
LPVLIVAVALAFTVGASRLFLRVLFASDVIAGFASGTVWLVMCVTSSEIIRRSPIGDRWRPLGQSRCDAAQTSQASVL